MKNTSRKFGGNSYSDYCFETLFKRQLEKKLKEDYAKEYADGELDRVVVEIKDMRNAVVTHPAYSGSDIDEIETLRIYPNYLDENGEYDFDFDFDKICYETIGLVYGY